MSREMRLAVLLTALAAFVLVVVVEISHTHPEGLRLALSGQPRDR